MAIGELLHSGFISSIKYDNLTPWVTTTEVNQIIIFLDKDGKKALNSLIIEADTTDLYVRMLPSEFCLYIPAGKARSYDLEKIDSIQIMGAINQHVRYYGMFY